MWKNSWTTSPKKAGVPKGLIKDTNYQKYHQSVYYKQDVRVNKTILQTFQFSL